ncbi:unnamed protein product [Linum trigynum]|uniref:non-specific serine/threonine protein kinase n=1 Tax=Linum trigynum TaxID=586398 RepID=A0AAV2FUI0_9ROSI
MAAAAAASGSVFPFPFLFLLSSLAFTISTQQSDRFIFHGFGNGTKNQQQLLRLDGAGEILPNGLLRLTNASALQIGHAFFPRPLNFIRGKSSLSFSTNFVFAMVPQSPNLGGHGLAFLLSPAVDFSHAVASQHLGLFNATTDGASTNHVVAIELDAMRSPEFQDIDNNHVGVDVNSLISIDAAPASYLSPDGKNLTLQLLSGRPIQVWIDYNDTQKLINVTLAPMDGPRPERPLLSTSVNLTDVLLDSMYVGFSAATSTVTSEHYILGWSFSQTGRAEQLDISKLPKLPPVRKERRKVEWMSIVFPILAAFVLVGIGGFVVCLIRRKKYEEICEDWEKEYHPQRFTYKNLYLATHGFKEKQFLGVGGFGKVYKGVLPKSETAIAVKRVSHDSRQGMKEFVAEIVSIGRLRHRNLVQLLGYCRRKGELLLVYDYMPNGSLDHFLFKDDEKKPTLNWPQRQRIIRGVASALLYLHEEWEQVVIHRDIKASNVLLDADFNGRLGDFGLARLHDHGTNSHTTQVAGTVGYLAPELTRLGKATTGTDVFAFGVFMLEVACGRRPVEAETAAEEVILVDWVVRCWQQGNIFKAVDSRLQDTYDREEMELVLKLGLLCSHPVAALRPSLRKVMQYLDGDTTLPEISLESAGVGNFGSYSERSDLYFSNFGSYSRASINSFCSQDSIITTGR